MTSLFSSKWLACAVAVALLDLAVIRTSHALKCHACGEVRNDCKPVDCPDEEFFREFGFPQNKTVDVVCVSANNFLKDSPIARDCNPNGEGWSKFVGGMGNCKTVDAVDILELVYEDVQLASAMQTKILEFGAEMKKLQDAGQELTPEMVKKLELLKRFNEKENQNRGRSMNSNNRAGKVELCACKTNLCNDEGLEEQMKTTTTTMKPETKDSSAAVSGFEFRSGAIIVIVLAAFACLSIAHGF